MRAKQQFCVNKKQCSWNYIYKLPLCRFLYQQYSYNNYLAFTNRCFLVTIFLHNKSICFHYSAFHLYLHWSVVQVSLFLFFSCTHTFKISLLHRQTLTHWKQRMRMKQEGKLYCLATSCRGKLIFKRLRCLWNVCNE